MATQNRQPEEFINTFALIEYDSSKRNNPGDLFF